MLKAIIPFGAELAGILEIEHNARQFHSGLWLFAHFGMFFDTGLLTAAAFFMLTLGQGTESVLVVTVIRALYTPLRGVYI